MCPFPEIEEVEEYGRTYFQAVEALPTGQLFSRETYPASKVDFEQKLINFLEIQAQEFPEAFSEWPHFTEFPTKAHVAEYLGNEKKWWVGSKLDNPYTATC